MRTRRLLGAAALVGVTPFLLVPAAHAEGADDQLTGYNGTASGAVFSLQPIFPGLLPTGDAPVEVTAGLSTASVQSGGNAFSRAEAVWPGDGAANLGPLLAQGAGQPIFYQMPAYPLGVQANQNSDTVSQGVTPGPVVKAVGKDGRSEAVVQAGGGGIPGIFTFGSVSSSSSADVVNGELVSKATVVLHDVVLGAGQVTIDAIKSVSTATSKGSSSASKGATDVTGLEIGGQKAAIDSDGLKGAGPLADGLKSALKAAGIELTLVDGAGKASGGTADRLSSGLLVTIANPAAAAHPQFAGSRFVIALAPTAAGALASEPFDSSAATDTGVGGPAAGATGGFSSISSNVADVYGTPTTTGGQVASGHGARTGLPAVFEPIAGAFPAVGGVPGGMLLALLAAIYFGSRWLSRFAARFVSSEE